MQRTWEIIKGKNDHYWKNEEPSSIDVETEGAIKINITFKGKDYYSLGASPLVKTLKEAGLIERESKPIANKSIIKTYRPFKTKIARTKIKDRIFGPSEFRPLKENVRLQSSIKWLYKANHIS